MPDKLHHTKGIVLRTVKYGETSVIVSIFTEIFGLQSYLVNGVRTSTKKGSGKANLFQPTAILELVVYHNDLKQLQRIKEFRWGQIYTTILSDVKKNAIALYMIELLTKCLKQPETNPEMYYFVEDSFLHLDKSDGQVAANFPLFFALHLPVFFGFRIQDNFSSRSPVLDLQEGVFTDNHPFHSQYLDDKYAEVVAQLLRSQHPEELAEIKLNQEFRRKILSAIEVYYGFHIQDFGRLKTIQILHDILS